MSQYAKVDEMENRLLQAVHAPIFEFRSAESETLLEATLELCQKTRVYNEIFLEINEPCEQSTRPTEQTNDPVPGSASISEQMEPTTFAQQAIPEAPALPVMSIFAPEYEFRVPDPAPEAAAQQPARTDEKLVGCELVKGPHGLGMQLQFNQFNEQIQVSGFSSMPA